MKMYVALWLTLALALIPLVALGGEVAVQGGTDGGGGTEQRKEEKDGRKEEIEALVEIVKEVADKGVHNLTLEIRTPTYTITLDMYANRQLLGPTYKANMVKKQMCDFLGQVRGDSGSLVALSVCGGLRGVVRTGGVWLEVTPAPNTHTLAGPHLLSHTHHHHHHHHHHQQLPKTCGVRGGDTHTRPETESGFKRVTRSLRGGRLWTQRNASYVELVAVVDSKLRQHLIDSSTSTTTPSDVVKKHVQSIMNIVNALYQPLGIVVVLTHVEIWETDKVEMKEEDSNTTFANAKTYLTEFRKGYTEPFDNMQLLTGVTFEGSTVGKGALGGMCGEGSVGVSMAGSRGLLGVAETVAHEMGHNLGLNHIDEVDGCDCTDCIMLSTGMGRNWDDCSIENVTKALRKGMECLWNRPEELEMGTCGDGVLGDGEECDCGPPQPPNACPHSCCDPKTCKLIGNATCGTGPCCDFETCQPHKLPVECRSATSTCDTAEHCNGFSEFCPTDDWVRDGVACGKEIGFEWRTGYCYNGVCGNAWERCEALFGEGATLCSPDDHGTVNTRGEQVGNCGIDPYDSGTYTACAKEDAECGTLLCHRPDKDEFKCWGIGANPLHPPVAWLTPNGAACGDGKMCVNQHCVRRPTAPSTIIFWVVVCFLAVLTLLCWDHVRYCWERKGGRTCCHTHLYYCGACLDACCFPCMNRLNRLILSVLPPIPCPKMPKIKLFASEGKGAAQVNGEVVSGREGSQSTPASSDRALASVPSSSDRAEVPNTGDFQRDFVQSPTRGATFGYRSSPGTVHVEVPLLAPLHPYTAPTDPYTAPNDPYTAPTDPYTTHNSDIENSDMGEFSDVGVAGEHPHPPTQPVRPAPPPPRPATDTPTDRPGPSVPPRPVLTAPLRPPVPLKPAVSTYPPVASFPPSSSPPPLPPKP